MDNPNRSEALRRAASSCRSYFAERQWENAGEALGRLLETLAEIEELRLLQGDHFERLKGLEGEVERSLEQLASSAPRQPAAEGGEYGDAALIFVYGTLKRGLSRSEALRGQHFIGEARTAPNYRMVDCGGYPGLVERTPGLVIEGELWQVNGRCLEQLDEIEGVAFGLYRRQPVLLQAPHNAEGAHAYFYARSVSGLRDCGTRW